MADRVPYSRLFGRDPDRVNRESPDAMLPVARDKAASEIDIRKGKRNQGVGLTRADFGSGFDQVARGSEVAAIKQKLTNHYLSGARIGTAYADSDSVGITTTETVVLSISRALLPGKRYRVRFYGGFGTAAAPQNILIRIREDSVSGQEMQGMIKELTLVSGASQNEDLEAEYDCTSAETKTFVVTLVRSGGSSTVRLEAFTSRKAYLYIDYIEDI